LIGDLTEQFAHGRSSLWYYRQAAGALAIHLLRAPRKHARSFLTAIFVGCAFDWLWHWAASLALQPLYRSLRHVNLYPWTFEALVSFAALLAYAASNGALVFLSVWIVRRIHRAHQRALLVVFVVALVALRVPRITQLAIERASDARVAASLNIEVVMTALQAIFTLVAGLWALRTQRFAEMARRTRFVAIGLVVQVTLASVLYSAWRVGALSYSRTEGYLLDAVEIASGAHLAFLLWRPRSASPRASIRKRQPGRVVAAFR
jgi:hypothetical protein